MKWYLVCEACGEAFDHTTPAKEHEAQHSDSTEEVTYRLLAEEEAF